MAGSQLSMGCSQLLEMERSNAVMPKASHFNDKAV